MLDRTIHSRNNFGYVRPAEAYQILYPKELIGLPTFSRVRETLYFWLAMFTAISGLIYVLALLLRLAKVLSVDFFMNFLGAHLVYQQED